MMRALLIANRGEIAVRIIRACRELGIRAVAVYSTVDAHALHVQMADAAVWIGDAPPQDSYLNIERLIEAARISSCDAVHPGYGFLSERAPFAQAVLDAGLIWVGPSPWAIAQMGVKTTARALMQAAGVPVVPGYQSDTATLDDLAQAAEQVGYPLMVKAAGGGGGKGIRIVTSADQLPDALISAQSEAHKAFNDPRVFLERYIAHGRHIEVQIIGDTHGNLVHLYERDCSTQRRHQKIIEEAPAPTLTPAQRHAICDSAVQAARAVQYVNAGTVEFIAAPDGAFYFLEMNTRLQVEHPVTEFVTGIDIVKTQLRIASGEPLPFQQDDITVRGHAIECRVYAEDPRNGFLPAIGTVQTFILPSGVGVRVDAGIQSGDAISVYYDPMIAKVIAQDTTRTEAIQRMIAALRQTVMLGTTTNIDFLRALLESNAFQQSDITTTTLDEYLADFLPAPSAVPDLALLAAALHDMQRLMAPPTGSSTASADPWDKPDSFRSAW